MLQDLDSLAARIEKTVALAGQLRTERNTLQAQLKGLEDEQRQLVQKLQEQSASFAALESRLKQGEQQMADAQRQANAQLAEQRAALAQSQARCATLEEQLAASRLSVEELGRASTRAREQIDSLLVRLPGATQE